MPERLPTAKPVVLVGTNVESGTPNTGQIPYTLGGSKTFSLFSGTAGGDALIQAGGGRLDAAAFVQGSILALSGQNVIFYDSAVAVSGGPIAASGHKIIGCLGTGAPYKIASSGDMFIANGNVQPMGFVYTSGLCYQSRSGVMAWNCSFTPVTSN